MIVAAGETLGRLPTLRGLWAGGLVSWGQVRAIVLAVRRLPVAARAHIDTRIAASVDAYGGTDAFDPDHLVDAVDQAAAEFCEPRNAERREERAQAVLFDGARPLAGSRKLHAEKVPDDVRLAVRARDMGDRMPGSRSPLGHTELHHFKHREDGGTNDPDNLGAVTRDHHLNRLHARLEGQSRPTNGGSDDPASRKNLAVPAPIRGTRTTTRHPPRRARIAPRASWWPIERRTPVLTQGGRRRHALCCIYCAALCGVSTDR